jgi:hypothetical protein
MPPATSDASIAVSRILNEAPQSVACLLLYFAAKGARLEFRPKSGHSSLSVPHGGVPVP